MLSQYRIGTVVKAVLSQMFIDIPDKVLSMTVAYLTVGAVRKKLSAGKKNGVQNEKA